MRRRAALYLLLGLVTALVVVGMATELQTGGSADPNVWMRAHRHVPLLQMLDLAAAFLFVVIGTYGLTVSRLQLQLRHQAEDFGDQMQSLVHRNDELAKVNEEYAEQIASLESAVEEPPALGPSAGSPRVIAALHWQVDAQARQLEAVHQALEHQQDALEELRQHVHTLEEGATPSLTGGSLSSPLLADASPAVSTPEKEGIKVEAVEFEAPETAPMAETAEQVAEAEESAMEALGSEAAEAPIGIADWTVNDQATLVGEMLDFDVSAFNSTSPSPKPSSPGDSPPPNAFTAARSYPVDDSFLAVTAGHLSTIPEPNPALPPQETERVEISLAKTQAAPMPPEAPAEPLEPLPQRTEGALALDLAESALSSLQSETQEALSSLRAQVEATIPQATSTLAPTIEPDKSSQAARRKPWHLRF